MDPHKEKEEVKSKPTTQQMFQDSTSFPLYYYNIIPTSIILRATPYSYISLIYPTEEIPRLIDQDPQINSLTSMGEARHMEIIAKLDEILGKQDIQYRRTEEIKEFIQKSNLTIIDCIKMNAAKNLQLICLFGVFVTLFSLVISVSLKIHLINPIFDILILIASTGFFFMTKSEEKRMKTSNK